MQSDCVQLAVAKTPTKMLDPVLWVQKNYTRGNKVYLGVVWWVSWEQNMDCFLPLKAFCLVLMEKTESYFNK